MAIQMGTYFTMKRTHSPAKSQQSATKGTFRLIAGEWRGRKFEFPAVEGLRPTPDRVRETLFNWLNQDVENSRCLDLFCGSGALGLEALSRGASSCTFIDADRKTTSAIFNHLQMLNDQRGKCIHQNLPSGLQQVSQQRFELIFIDPPYVKDELLTSCLQLLLENNCLQAGSHIYIENSASHALPPFPDLLKIRKQKVFGQVQSTLLYYPYD